MGYIRDRITKYDKYKKSTFKAGYIACLADFYRNTDEIKQKLASLKGTPEIEVYFHSLADAAIEEAEEFYKQQYDKRKTIMWNKITETLSTAWILAACIIAAGVGMIVSMDDPGLGGLTVFVGLIYLSYTLYWSLKK